MAAELVLECACVSASTLFAGRSESNYIRNANNNPDPGCCAALLSLQSANLDPSHSLNIYLNAGALELMSSALPVASMWPPKIPLTKVVHSRILPCFLAIVSQTFSMGLKSGLFAGWLGLREASSSQKTGLPT